jgi:hypothetical protein
MRSRPVPFRTQHQKNTLRSDASGSRGMSDLLRDPAFDGLICRCRPAWSPQLSPRKRKMRVSQPTDLLSTRAHWRQVTIKNSSVRPRQVSPALQSKSRQTRAQARGTRPVLRPPRERLLDQVANKHTHRPTGRPEACHNHSDDVLARCARLHNYANERGLSYGVTLRISQTMYLQASCSSP